MTHPLTTVMCYDMTVEDSITESMRNAADWQLDRCTEELNQILYIFELAGKIDEEQRMALLNVFMESMRPQVVDLPQANSDVCGEEGMKRALQRTIDENGEAMRLLADS